MRLIYFSLSALFLMSSALVCSDTYAFGRAKPKPSPSPTPSSTPSSTPTPTPTPSPSPIANAEPAFCTPAQFYRTEFPIDEDGLDRAHAFKIGRLTLVGLAVGSSGIQELKDLSYQLGRAEARPGANEKYCTWYFNDGEETHARTFNWKYLDFPDGEIAPMVDRYERDLGPVFTERTNSFLECSERNHYVAFGCDGMSHRGPTAMAMFLAYVGCSPKNAVEIAVHYWGRNGITDEMRKAIATRAGIMSSRDPAARQRLLNLMLAR